MRIGLVCMIGIVALLATHGCGNALSQGESRAHADAGAPPRSTADDIGALCLMFARGAADDENAKMLRRLEELSVIMDKKATELGRKVEALRDWMARREAATNKASDAVVAIYGKMKPESAASQIANMEDVVAVAILDKLNAKAASAILNEMEPAVAARMAGRLSSGNVVNGSQP